MLGGTGTIPSLPWVSSVWWEDAGRHVDGHDTKRSGKEGLRPPQAICPGLSSSLHTFSLNNLISVSGRQLTTPEILLTSESMFQIQIANCFLNSISWMTLGQLSCSKSTGDPESEPLNLQKGLPFAQLLSVLSAEPQPPSSHGSESISCLL